MNKDVLTKTKLNTSQVLEQLLDEIISSQKVDQICKNIIDRKSVSLSLVLDYLDYILLNNLLDKEKMLVSVILYIRICQEINVPSRISFVWQLEKIQKSFKANELLYEMLVLQSYDEV